MAQKNRQLAAKHARAGRERAAFCNDRMMREAARPDHVELVTITHLHVAIRGTMKIANYKAVKPGRVVSLHW